MKVAVKTEEAAAGPSGESAAESVDTSTKLSTIFKNPDFKASS